TFLHLFACTPRLAGVNQKCELIRLRREHDSTGLRAKPKLITPLLRCASPENTRAVSVASETTQQKKEMGSRQAPHFILRVMAPRRRAVAVMMVAGAMPVDMAVVRSGFAGRRTRTIVAGLRSRFSCRSLPRRG